MIHKNDWRVNRQRKYMEGISLQWKPFVPYRGDSDHCEFCWAKFMNVDTPDVLREGYSTPDNYYWICKNCYDDFKEMFGWKIKVPE